MTDNLCDVSEKMDGRQTKRCLEDGPPRLELVSGTGGTSKKNASVCNEYCTRG